MSSTTPIPLPSRNERSAPQFDPDDEAHLPAFFDEFEKVAKAAGIEGDATRMKKEVLKYVDSKTMKYWRSLESYTDAAMNWPEFRKEVTENYPDAVEDQEANIEDLRKVIASFKKQGIKGNQELAMYHREFAAVASILKSQGTLSEVQLSQYYVSVLTSQMQQRLDVRLQIQFTAKKKGEAFKLSELKDAISFFLSDSTPIPTSANFSTGDPSVVPVLVKPELTNNTISELAKQVASLSSMFAQFKKESESSSAVTSQQAAGSTTKQKKACRWDGCESRKFSDCENLKDWLAKGRIIREASSGLVRLKGGASLPDDERYSKGLIKERFERYFDDHPSKKSWTLEIAPESPSLLSTSLPGNLAGIEVSRHTPYSIHAYQGPAMLAKSAAYLTDSTVTDEERNELKEVLMKMETRRVAKVRFERDPPPHTSQQPDPEPAQPIPNSPPAAKPPKPIIGKLPETYVPPTERTVGAPPKDDRNYRFRAPIESEATIQRAIEAGMSTIVPIRQDDLLAIAPDYRKKVRDSVMARRIALDGALTEDINLSYMFNHNGYLNKPRTYKNSASVDLFQVFFNDMGDAEEGDGFYVARDSHSIRGINAIIGEHTVHCIDDGGCSIVAMSDVCANVLGIAFDPSKVIPLQSANGQTNYSLGLAKDVPFKFCGLTAFLQVHIVPSPAYDVLLGRPFQVLMQAVYKNFLSGDQHVTLTDPNTHNIITIPTVPRELPRFRKGDGRDLRK
ncbi:hypothetical protein DFH05DRAFT_1521786 [Lentinula detonsa]|uniref:Uncharacterized protein n=1 Tax=Lentinula detonsa TaxID=2804962 RepID=A0A9W8P5P2_9AGAR|nr:hypothetical protein DFH05DRAFT_1521786 [Lentinula detonsa]